VACRKASEQAECVVSGGSGFGCEANELEPWIGHELHGFVTEIEVAHVRVMEKFLTGKVYPHIVGFPEGRELAAAIQELIDEAQEGAIGGRAP
jgi:hypothetical protein